MDRLHVLFVWIGCTEDNELCTRCYAATMMDRRFGRTRGLNGTRQRAVARNLRKPLLFRLIDQTTQLNWLMLTKRPKNIGRMRPPMTDVSDSFTAIGPQQWVIVGGESGGGARLV